MRILIIGHGFVGKAVDYGFSHPSVHKTIVDPKYGTIVDSVDARTYDFIFVCVPTPMGEDGRIDTTILDNVMALLDHQFDHRSHMPIPTIIIKSTVTPDIVKYLPYYVVYNPEFLTEKSANEQFVDPQFHIIGATDETRAKSVANLYEQYSLCNPSDIFYMTPEEASFVKYTINSFLAMKVTFFNQLYDAVADTDANFGTIIKAVGSDKRIGHSHTKVPGFDGKQGFGGACFPKDTSAFVSYSNCLTLLKECININNKYREGYELDDREKEQNITYGDDTK